MQRGEQRGVQRGVQRGEQRGAIKSKIFRAAKVIGKLAKQSATYGVSTILGRLLSYLLTPYYTRLFTTDEYGIITDLYALIPFALVLFTMGLESGYFRFAARAESEGVSRADIRRRKKRLYATTWGLTCLVSVAFTGFVVFNIEEVNRLMGEAYMQQPYLAPLVACVIMFDVMTALPFARFREQGEVKKYVMLNMLNIVLQVGLAILYGSIGLFDTPLGVGWVLLANLPASMITFALAVTLARPYVLPLIDWRLMCRVVIYSMPLLLSGIAATATDFLDRQLIKYIAPENAMAQLGLYGAVAKIAVVMTLFTQMYRLAAEPYFLANFKKEEFVESNAEAMKYYIIATMTIFLGITLSSDLFMYIVGSDFREGETILPVILLSNLLMGVWLNLSFWYKREERTRYALVITLWGLVVSVVANIFMIPPFGYEGAAWARLISQVAMVGISYSLMRRHFPIPYDLRRIGEYVLVCGAVCGVGVWIESVWSGLGASLMICMVLVVSYLGFVLYREGVDFGAALERIKLRKR
ncbi:MAG: oligosaccharide flippase family protein [Rikenellaceae bacterium]